VATSCVEAGVDLSFRTGFRERSSLNSLLQTGGRVNRQGKFSSAMVWDFTLKNEGLVKANPGLKTSVSVLSTLFAENKIGPEYSTLALQREIRFDTQNQTAYDLMTGEKQCNFPFVEKEFHVIDSNTVTAVVKWDLVERLNRREKITANEIMSFSVQIPKYRTTELALEELRYHSGLYEWKLDYNDFLGYMAGVIAILSATDGAYYE
jgi:CRISPR/Cas system-associated endonuclease/helicase Cas3